ncbi:GNAT family N-acetyltransferase [uncultured Croceitalea sp.]|uniref:GNAT family N-acetyltransferase n=1 Tax=uncultured Croceitalea sp. TaxID=1798908 RepID=UPI003305C937
MRTRTYNRNDKESIIRLVKDGLAEFGFDYLTETSESDLVDIEEEYLYSNGTFLVLENENGLLGTGGIKEIGEGIYKIRKMYVHKSQRGKGYGKQILTQLIDFAIWKKAKKVVLETSVRMTSAIALYKNFGFETVNEKPVSSRCDLTFTKDINHG